MADLKTRPTDTSITKFVDSLTDEQQQADTLKLIEIMSKVSGSEPVMWGGAIIGFGSRQLKYASGRELDWPRLAFSPRKGKITLYVTQDADQLTSNFKDLGKYKLGKGCIYLKQLADIDQKSLVDLIETAHRKTLEEDAR